MFSRSLYGFHFVTIIVSLFLVTSFSVLKVNSEKSSLFDELPLNGAYSESSYTSKNHRPHKESKTEPSPRHRSHYKKAETPTKLSLFDELPNQGALSPSRGRVRNPRDSVDFDVTRVSPSNEFDIQSWDSRLLSPIVNYISRPAPRGPPPRVQQNPRGQQHYGPPPPPSPQGVRNVYGPPPPSRTHSYSYHNHNHQPPPRMPTRQEIPTGQNKSVNHVSANSGGPTVIVYAHPNKGQPGYVEQPTGSPSGQERTESKNEVHYHYHINQNNNDEELYSTSTGGYTSGSGGYRSSPLMYGRPTSSRRERPNKPSQAYGPVVRGYPESRYNLREKEQKDSYSNTRTEDHLTEEDDDFKRRTFFTPSREKLSRPSTSYEVPPSFNAPSSSYNAPSNDYGPAPAVSDSYGPPTSPPAPPPPSSDQAGGDQYETTITLQTIPVTRQVTELVQVPNVVHKISSNRPSGSNQAVQDEPINTPTSSYGPPAPPPPRNNNNIPQSSRDSTRGSDRPFDSHLAQILGVGPTQNPKDAVLQELLLGQARQPGLDLTISDLEVFSLLQGSRGQGSSTPILTPGRNLFGGLFGGNGGSSRLAGGNALSSLFQQPREQGLSSDGLGSLREAFREQRFQLALADLRKQLREQNKDNVRERSSYRSLFTKGALLLSALTMLPSFVNPMASAAGVGAAASTIPNFMLPVVNAGRRKRSTPSETEKVPPWSKTAFEKCLEDFSQDKKTKSIPYEKWSACDKNLTISFPAFTTTTRQSTPSQSRSIIWQGGISPKMIQSDLEKYVHRKDLAKASKCIQRDFCRNVQEIEKLPEKDALLLTYSIFAGDIDKNKWIKECLLAAENDDCSYFSCKNILYIE